MRVRTFRVPFSDVVGKEAAELEFDPETDYLMVRSLFAQPSDEVREFAGRLAKIDEKTSQREADAVILDLLDRTVVEWHLAGPDGEIARPTKAKELDALPGAVRGSLFGYLASFRGQPDPTPAD